MKFLDKVLQTGENNPDIVALRSGEESLTYGELCRLSGQIYAYLEKEGIGREDRVLLHLERGVRMIAAMIGVWRAGAAFAACENSMPENRVLFIKQDCGCIFTLDDQKVDEAQKLQPRSGYALIDDHDAAFAVYTSGSTGEPKGVLHEFGKIQYILEVDANTGYDHHNQVFGCIAPMSTVATILLMVPMLYNEGLLDIVPSATIKDPTQFARYIISGKVRMLFFPPSLFKLLPGLPPNIETVFVSSERADNVYRNNLCVINGYALSEAGFTPFYHTVQPEDQVTPVGRPMTGLKAFVINDDGEVLPNGEMGELVLENPFTRGYLHQELNANTFRDGYLYTGDIAKYDANGDLVILGRKDEMIKICGNRIEPAEIEKALRQVLNVSWAVVRAFKEQDYTYLCAYYREPITITTEEAREALSKLLPDYMIPGEFLYMPQIPMLPSGKPNKKAFPKPQRSQSGRYVPPQDELQREICEAFAVALKRSPIGIHDDFYQLGGDSLSAMVVSTTMNMRVPLEMLLIERTPSKIAEKLQNGIQKEYHALQNENAKAMMSSQPLTAMQRYVIKYQMVTPYSTMWNLPLFLRFDKDSISTKIVQKAMTQILRSHPALQTIITLNRNGVLEQRWRPDLSEPLEIEHVTEAELQVLKDDLVYPFTLFNRHLYHCRIFETEAYGYLFMDIHHSVTDGFSYCKLREELLHLIRGQKNTTADLYYLFVSRENNCQELELYKKAEAYYRETYGGDEWSMYPHVDHEHPKDNRLGEAECPLSFAPDELENTCKLYGITTNELCMAAFLLAVAQYNQCTAIQGVWVYNGRNDEIMKDTVGLLFRIMPIAMRFHEGQSINEVFNSIREQIRQCILYNCYPFALNMFESIVQDRASCFYQTKALNDDLLYEQGIIPQEITSKYNASCGVLDTSVYDDGDGLIVHMDYAGSRYEASSIERFMNCMVNNIRRIVNGELTEIHLEGFGV